MPDILHLLRIDATPERVYNAVITAEQIRNWWTRDADLDPAVGGAGEFRFSSYGNGHGTSVVVAELTPFNRVSWKVTASFRPEWIGTSIEFDLRPDASSTLLHFAHRDFQDADDVFALCNTGWAYYLVSLKHYLETGHGAPSPDVNFARLIGRP